MLIHRRQDPALAEAAQRELLSDDRLSLVATGVLMKLLNHAPEWAINAATFYETCAEARGPQAESKRGIRTVFRELEELGYMRRTRGRKPNGDFYTWLEVSDVPNEFGETGPIRDRGILPLNSDSVVYAIGATEGHIVKIGTTRDIVNRLSGIQNGHPYPLHVKWTCPGSVELEAHLHRKFDTVRMQGEWFNFGGDDPVCEISKAAELFYELPPGTLTHPADAHRVAS